MEADIEFVAPCQKEINAYVANGVPVFAYSFDYVPQSPIYEEVILLYWVWLMSKF